ncbi:MAG TPA: TonB-dependent receptor [Pyrinomonadaceae bacterium]|nr:TonB-dependent receptor [Pyrinomonadaceae bacterium]
MSNISRSARRVLTALMVALCLSAMAASVASAQTTTATVGGTVKDAQGAVVAGATVTLTDMATGREVTASTNSEGAFIFTDVRSGDYVLTAESAGFKKTETRGVKVNVGMPATVNLELQPGGVAEVVTTTASEAQTLVNTENAELGTTVYTEQINDLPLNGRNPVQLARLQAGVATVGGTRSATINGMRGSYNNITWDGINVQETYLRGSTNSGLFAQAGPSVSGVGEFTITTQNAGSSDGTGAAQIKLVTPRGSSQLHGSLFEYHRNDVFDANSFFNNRTGLPKEKLIQNQFGVTVGGPFALPRFGEGGPRLALKNKLFFYTYYEETRAAEQAALTRTTLTAAARQGNFTYRRSDNGQLQTVNLLSLTGRQLDPRIQSLLNLTPVPNDITAAGDRVNTGGFRFNSPAGSTDKLFGFRIDYEASSRNRFEAVFSRNALIVPNDATTNNTGEPFPGLPGKGQSPKRQRGALAWFSNWGQNVSNELRAGYYRQSSIFFTNVQFPEGNLLAFPSVGTTVTNPVQNSQVSGRGGEVYELMDNASWVKGSHLFRFGANLRSTAVEPFSFAGILPTYTLGFGSGNINPLNSTNRTQFPGGVGTTDFTNASNLLALLTGAITSASQTFNVTGSESGFVKGAEQRRNLGFYALGFYASDTWRLRDNLTVNFGLRYDYYDPVQEENGIGLLPVGGLEALQNPNVVLDLAGGGNGTRPFYNPDKNNFAPNFSFSWDPFGGGRTAVRGGYSINFVIDSVIQATENSAIDGNDGLTSTQSLTGLNGTVSGGGIIPINTPAFKVPRTLADQQLLNQSPTIFTIDPNLRTPYVQQWNVGVEREVLRNTVAEIRYVGNRGVKQLRGIDINQVRIFENGFLQDFRRAQNNLNLSEALRQAQDAANVIPVANRVVISPAYNPAVKDSQQLTIIPQVGRRGLFTTATGTTLDSTILNLIRTGQVGELANRYVSQRNTYLTPGTNGAALTPGFFLPANPAAGNVDYLGNGSSSNYHAMQAELRMRFGRSLHFQTNYTWSKALTDFDGSDANFAALLDITLGQLEKRRALNDIRHVFKANGIYALPLGPGKRFLGSTDGVVGKLLGGWEMTGIFEARTGRPITLVSARGTVNRAGRSGRNTVNTSLTLDELRGMTGLFTHPTTGRPLYLDPRLIGPDGRANPEFFQNPAAGTYGNLQQTPIDGPGYWNLDLGFIKRTRINERMNIELRAEMFNALNHTNFFIGSETQDINSESFGQIGGTFDPRIMQFAIKFNF